VTPARISLPPGRLRKVFSLKHVAARLLPPSGGPLGARVALLEVTGGVGKRAFPLSSLSFLVSGFTPRGQGGDGAGEGGSRPRASDHLSDDSCAGGDDPKTIGSACLASSPTLPWCYLLSAKRMFKMLWQKRVDDKAVDLILELSFRMQSNVSDRSD
jgi:hypothetical protein